MAPELGGEGRRGDEHRSEDGDRDPHRPAELALRDLDLAGSRLRKSFGGNRVSGGDPQRPHADGKRLDQDVDTPDERRADPRVVSRVPRQEVDLSGDLPVGQPNGKRPTLRPPHHHALDEGLAPDGRSPLPPCRGGLAAHLRVRRGPRGARTSSRSAPPGLPCPRASACPCRRGGTASRSPPSGPPSSTWSETYSRTSTGRSPARSRDGSRSSSLFPHFDIGWALMVARARRWSA